MPNPAVLEEIREFKKKNSFVLLDVPFFKIEKDGHEAYLFGTDHSYDIATLPHSILELIKSADKLFLENGVPTQEDFAEFLQYMRIKHPSQRIKLKPSSMDLLRELITDYIGRISEETYEQSFDFLDLEPVFLLFITDSIIDSCLEKIELTSSSEEDCNNKMMEQRLLELFDYDVSPLEPYALGSRGLPQFYDEALEELEKEKLPFCHLFVKQYVLNTELSSEEQEIFAGLKDKFIMEHSAAKTTYSADILLNDFSRAIDVDNEIDNLDSNLDVRNTYMFTNIIKSTGSYKLPLYCVGADHLIGKLGLINTLQSNGYRVYKVMLPNVIIPGVLWLSNHSVYCLSNILECCGYKFCIPILSNRGEVAYKPITYSYAQYKESYDAIKAGALNSRSCEGMNASQAYNKIKDDILKDTKHSKLSLS